MEGKVAKEKKNEGGEKQISSNLSLGADLESDGHNRAGGGGGGDDPEACTAQPY